MLVLSCDCEVTKTKTILHLLGLSLLLQVLGSEGLRDVRLEAKRYTREGQEFMLRCSYDLESETLYAVKWYRGQEEFYRFIPKEFRPKKVFPGPGIFVDYFQSDDHYVVLKNVSSETNGKYKCSVSVEGSFQTISDSKDITVVVVGYESPKLWLKNSDYLPGDRGEAFCTIDPTFPPINITWLMNNQSVSNDKVNTTVVEDDTNPRLTSTFSTLYFRVPSQGSMSVKCLGQLYDVYFMVSNYEIHPTRSNSHSGKPAPNSLQRSCAQFSFEIPRRKILSFLAILQIWVNHWIVI